MKGQNAKKTDSETKRVKAEDAFEEAAESKIKKRNMTYNKEDFYKDKV
ncbi:hypothetical protein [Clostridium hydrogenum]|nr:hypothetical protein [Clostridium hydrogenum]